MNPQPKQQTQAKPSSPAPAATGATTTSGQRKAWIKKTPAEIVLGEIRKQEERVAEMREDLAREERQLTKLQQAKKIFEAE